MRVLAPWGHGPDGKPLSPDERKLLRNGVYRNRDYTRKPTPNERHAAAIDDILIEAARLYGIPRHWITHPPEGRREICARARRHAAHRLKQDLNLSLPNIAKALNYADHSAVKYCLGQPVEPP